MIDVKVEYKTRKGAPFGSTFTLFSLIYPPFRLGGFSVFTA